MTRPRWRGIARAQGMSSATIRTFPRLVRAVVTGVLPQTGWRTTKLPRHRRRQGVVVITGPMMGMVEACR